MDTDKIRAEATKLGVREGALEDVENRALKAFLTQPEPGVLALWLREQIAQCPFFLDPRITTAQPPAVFEGNPSERITWARQHGLVDVYDRDRRRFHPQPPPELVAEWMKLPPIPRRTAQLEWEAAQQPKR